MAKAKVENQVCLSHTDRQAVSRCETCFKPLCEECILEKDGVHFCSEACVVNYAESGERVQQYEAVKRRERRRKLRRRLLLLIIIIALGAAAYHWHKSNPKRSKELREKLQKEAQKAKKKVQ